jgi:hypothetical protein
VEETCGRGAGEREFKLLDTGVLNEGRYFDLPVGIHEGAQARLTL